ncbi:hypothetical protein SO802_034764 [Lithocarpus litseifolius]|uniref:Uncharacterized protein n=1 Tax=Lithocarpus litseifolius TaxID=425828 RepID=A0AAW2BGW1_9ROSI
MESPTSVRPFLRHTAFAFWSQRFAAVTIPGSLREGICTPAMHGYRQAVMTSFERSLMGSRGFSLIPPEGLSAVISANPRLLLPSKSVLAYAWKQNRLGIFKWDDEEKGWFWHTGDYPAGWEKKVKVINIPVPKKGATKPKSAKKSTDPSETSPDVQPKVSKSKSTASQPSSGAPPSSRTRGSKRKSVPPLVVTTTERRSKFKEDTSATQPISVDDPESEVEETAPSGIAEAETISPATPFVISTSDPFLALSQAAKDGSSLVVTPSSIPSSATRGPDMGLSSEGSEDILEDRDDEPVMKKVVSDSDEDEDIEHGVGSMETSHEPKIAADMSTAIPPAVPVVSATFTASAFTGPSLPIPSQFELGSSSSATTVPPNRV